jgi:hypothetical protein
MWDDVVAQQEGTHSIIDMDRVIDPSEPDGFSTVRPLTDAEVRRYFGTDRPTRGDFDRAYAGDGPDPDLRAIGPNWSGHCVVLYDLDGSPSAIAFWGFSGD